jgi:hypothetical protein
VSAPRRPSARAAATCLALAALLAPATAAACAVCGGGNPANRFAFFASTIALSLLPLGLFVGAYLWLRSRLMDRGRLEFGEREPAARPPADRAPRTD